MLPTVPIAASSAIIDGTRFVCVTRYGALRVRAISVGVQMALGRGLHNSLFRGSGYLVDLESALWGGAALRQC
jgi:hypothetical protein